MNTISYVDIFYIILPDSAGHIEEVIDRHLNLDFLRFLLKKRHWTLVMSTPFLCQYSENIDENDLMPCSAWRTFAPYVFPFEAPVSQTAIQHHRINGYWLRVPEGTQHKEEKEVSDFELCGIKPVTPETSLNFII